MQTQPGRTQHKHNMAVDRKTKTLKDLLLLSVYSERVGVLHYNMMMGLELLRTLVSSRALLPT